MHATLTTGQVQRWYQFMRQVPVGERRDDLRLAQLIAHMRAAQGQKHQAASDYLLPFDPEPEDEKPILEKLRMSLRMALSLRK